MQVYIIHYGEIFLKGKNRGFFESKLKTTINQKISNLTSQKVQKIQGKLVINDDNPKIANILKLTPGITHYELAHKVENDLTQIKTKALELLQLKKGTFKIHTVRTSKKLGKTSVQINNEIGAHILQNTESLQVDLKNPNNVLYIEVGDDASYMYTDKLSGIGGMPVGSAGKVVALLSGGIDSPVAAANMMKRGCEVILVHGFNRTVKPQEVRKKIYELAQQLAKIQGKITLYLIPYGDIQTQIVAKIPEKRRMLLFKRSLIRTANIIATQNKAKAIVLGDSLAQVASQTLENINVIYDASNLSVLAPLISHDKLEIINQAKHIGTYDISIIPYPDCCSLIATKNPEIKGRKCIAQNQEQKIDYKNIENEMLQEMVSKTFE